MAETKKTPIIGWIICSLAALFYFYEYLLRIEPAVMVKELMVAFEANATTIGVLSAFYYFIYTPMQIFVGLLSDLYGPRKILTIAIIACAVGSYIFGIAPNLFIASVGRLLIGFGSAFAFVCVLKLTASWLPHRLFALFVGLATALGMAGGMFGVIVLSSLVKTIGWKQTVDTGTIIGAILIPIIWLIIKDEPKDTKKKIKEKNKVQYKETFSGLFKILKNPQMWITGIISCFFYLSLSLFAELWGIPFIKMAYPKVNAATACSMVFFGWLVGGPFIGYVSDMIRTRHVLISIGCIVSAILISIIIYIPNISHPLLYLLLFIFGVFSSVEILCFVINSERNPRNLIATAAAFTNTLTMSSGIIAQPLIGKILDSVWSGEMIDNIRIYSLENYKLALTTLPIALLIGFILSLLLRKNYEKKFS